jgi:hypothetical protein
MRRARAATKDGAGVHRAHAARVIDAAGGAGMDHGEIIGMTRDMLNQSEIHKPPWPCCFQVRLHSSSGDLALSRRRERSLEARGQRLPGQLVQQRLVIKGVQMARAAFHEEEDDALRLRRAMRQTQRRGLACRP